MAGQNNFPFIINVGNSIIGVTILAMPFCFKACGIILGSLLLLFSTWLTLVSCQLLLKAGVTARRRSYSFLAYFTHGAIGKLTVEIGMIGLQLGTLVAQVVIIGDLGPAIVSKALGLPNTDNLRTGLIIFLCLFLGLPLGLLKDVRMLSNTSTMCIMFYSFFTIYVILQSVPNLLKGQWYNKVTFWRLEGFFQCLPIFSFAFGCQTQMFIVYDALAEPSLKRMNSIVSSAVNMCAVAYLLVGFFGNVAFCDTEISGDIVNHFKQNSVSDGIKLCFVMSIAVSIPLIVFPCRVSLYNLLFPQKPKEDVPGSGKIPEFHFKAITISIVVGSMIIGIMVPNVEFVLGLNGATMGSLICYIFPALFFLNVMYSSVEGKWTARMVLVFGLTILIASTYTTLVTQEKKVETAKSEDIQITNDKLPDIGKTAKVNVDKIVEQIKPVEESKKEDAGAGLPVKVDSERREPPNPLAPEDKEVPKEEDAKEIPKKLDKPPDGEKENLIEEVKKDGDTGLKKDVVVLEKDGKGIEGKDDKLVKADEEKEKREIIEEKEKLEEKEKKQDEILGKLAEQQEEQQKLIKEQKQILEELKQHKEEHMEKDASAKKDQQNLQNIGNEQNVLQPVQQAAGPQVQNQQLGQVHLHNQQVVGQQGLQNQPMGLQQQQNQPVAGKQQQVQVAGVGGQQQLQNQPMGGQQQVQNQPVGGQQQVQNQPIGGHQQVQNQPMGRQQQEQNQPMGGQQQVQNQPMGGQQQVQNQPVGGQQQVQNQPIGMQQQVQNQPIGEQQIGGQQPVVGQEVLQNQPLRQHGLKNEAVLGQQQIQDQPVIAQNGVDQQKVGIPNDFNVQHQQAQQKLQQGLQQGAEAGGQQLIGNVPVQNIQAGHDVNVGLQNVQQGQQPIVHAQQVVNPAGIQQDKVGPAVVGNEQQNIGGIKDQHQQDNVANQDIGNNNHDGKDDALKRRKRDVEDSALEGPVDQKEQGIHQAGIIAEKPSEVADQVIKEGDTGNIQRDLRQIKPTKAYQAGDIVAANQPAGDYVDDMIQSMKDDLLSGGKRKSPFIVEMAGKNLGSKRR